MTRLEALTALAEKVERGTAEGITAGPFGASYPGARHFQTALPEPACNLAIDAYHGSLDAAQALHDATLISWDAHLQMSPLKATIDSGLTDADVYMPYSNESYGATDAIPARAWLLAILRALIAQTQKEAV